MKNDLADITILLDKSGSMYSIANDTIGGLNKFIDDQKKLPGHMNLTLIKFNNKSECQHNAIPIQDFKPLDHQNYCPGGNTALLDACGKAIIETGQRLKNIPEQDRPGKILFVIITDGQENSSTEYTRTLISEMIKHQTDVYKWSFVFLGANQDSFTEAHKLGILAANTCNYQATGPGVLRAMNIVSSNITNYRSSKQTGPNVTFFDNIIQSEKGLET